MFFIAVKALIDFRIFDSVNCGNVEPKQGIIWTVDDKMLVLDSELVMRNADTMYKTLDLDELQFHNISKKQNGFYKCFSRKTGALLSQWDVVLKRKYFMVFVENLSNFVLNGSKTICFVFFNRINFFLIFWIF